MLAKLTLLLTVSALVVTSSGCMSFFGKKNAPPEPTTDINGAPLPGTALSSDPAQSDSLPGTSLENLTEEPEGFAKLAPSNLWKSTKKAVGLGPDQNIARAAQSQGEALFRAGDYKGAAKQFKIVVSRWPDSALEEDAMFWMAESYFFSDKYPNAEDTYDGLIKKYASTKYLDQVIVRQFAIAQYWYQYDQANPRWPIVPNLVDRSRPLFDTGGHGMNVYDHVRLNDPRGPLADDAIMAKANAFFLKKRYEDADYYYSLIRKDYPKSEHLVKAYQLGLQSKILMYQGPEYDGRPLDGANELLDQMLVQFPGELSEDRDRLLTVKKELLAQRAKRDFDLAQLYDNGKNYGAARYYYQGIVKDYPNSSFADQSKERLAQIGGEPDSPANRLAWLDRIFDKNYRQDMARKQRAEAASSETIMR